ncbi:MAG: hypothetical protein WC455_11840 [Dehalococcoidia bacterium]|jgi:hypothetical protein
MNNNEDDYNNHRYIPGTNKKGDRVAMTASIEKIISLTSRGVSDTEYMHLDLDRIMIDYIGCKTLNDIFDNWNFWWA